MAWFVVPDQAGESVCTDNGVTADDDRANITPEELDVRMRQLRAVAGSRR